MKHVIDSVDLIVGWTAIAEAAHISESHLRYLVRRGNVSLRRLNPAKSQSPVYLPRELLRRLEGQIYSRSGSADS